MSRRDASHRIFGLQRGRKQPRIDRRRRWHSLERLESRYVLDSSLSGQLFEDLNGDHIWQSAAPNREPALPCWSVFLDSNRNGVLDEGEPQQHTNSSGFYQFNVAAPGEYAVELAPEPGYDRTKPIRFGLSTTLVAGSVQDHVFDPVQSILYATAGDRVLRTNTKTPEDRMASLAFGTSLTALDVTPNGKFLVVGEAAVTGGIGRLYKVAVATGAVTTIEYSVQGAEGGVFDLAAVSDDRVLWTTTSSTNASVPLRELNLTTNAITTRPESFGAGPGEVQPHSRLERNANRSALVLLQAHDPAGLVHRYATESNRFIASTSLNHPLENAHVSISRDGKLLAVESPGLGLKVYDESFQLVTTLAHFRGGVAFDSIRNILYAGDTTTDELVAMDTSNWNVLYRVAAGEDLPVAGTYFEMQLHPRASYLSLTTPSGVRFVRLDRPVPHVVTLSEGQAIERLDFGNWANGENRRPRALDDSLTVAEDTLLSISAPGILGNDVDPENSSLRSQLVTGTQHGTLSLQPDGSFSYRPNDNYFGPDSFSYHASDGQYLSCRPATVRLNVLPVNDPPTQITLSGASVDENELGGSIGQIVVVDADPNDLFGFVLSDARFEIVNGTLRLRTGVSLDHEQAQTIELTITATDNGSPSLSVSTTITIQVEDVNEFDPTVETTEIEVVEGGTTVGTVETNDEDSSQTLQTTIVGGNDGGVFSIDPGTGVITVNDGHELNYDQTPIYVLTIRVTDDVEPYRETEATVTIAVQPSNPNAPIAEDAIFSLAENSPPGTVVGTVVASDLDPGTTLTYELAGGSVSPFEIDPLTGEITVRDATQLDFEALQQFIVLVLVSDGGPRPKSDQAAITVRLTDVNEFAPQIGNFTFSVDENSVNGTLVGAVSASDGDIHQTITYSISGTVFAIHPSSGVITVADSSQLDHEVAESISVTVTATDSGNPARSSTGTVTVNLGDLNEFAPVVPDRTFNVTEHSPVGHVVGTVTVTDADTTHGFSFAFTEGNADGVFAINAATGVITVLSPGAIDFETVPLLLLVVRVSDNGVPALSDTGTVTVNVQGINEPPTGIALDSASVMEFVPGATVGLVSVIDPDAGDTHTLSVNDTRFTIDANRILKLKPGRELNRDDAAQIPIEITATDAGGFKITERFVIQVLVNPKPWQNSVEPLDVNADGQVTPGDILLVINELNNPTVSSSTGELPSNRPDLPNVPFYDVNGDGIVSPIDILLIINELNRRALENQAEGEASDADGPAARGVVRSLANRSPGPTPVGPIWIAPARSFSIADDDEADRLGDLESTLDELVGEWACFRGSRS